MRVSEKFFSRDFVSQFLQFAVISGMGWTFDLGCYYLLYKYFFISPVWANVISSFLAITFVWLTSVSRVFGVSDGGKTWYIFFYWIYQSLSILIYSFVLLFLYRKIADQNFFIELKMHAEMVAKVFVTPFNLATNFLFMKYLMRQNFLIKNHDR